MRPYKKPSIELLQAECAQMTAISLQNGSADTSKEVLTKENNAWNMWEED